jgi:hypothetical protein
MGLASARPRRKRRKGEGAKPSACPLRWRRGTGLAHLVEFAARSAAPDDREPLPSQTTAAFVARASLRVPLLPAPRSTDTAE